MWTKILKTERGTYWKMEKQYYSYTHIYNITLGDNPPTNEAGYFELASLMKLKNENWMVIQAYKNL